MCLLWSYAGLDPFGDDRTGLTESGAGDLRLNWDQIDSHYDLMQLRTTR